MDQLCCFQIHLAVYRHAPWLPEVARSSSEPCVVEIDACKWLLGEIHAEGVTNMPGKMPGPHGRHPAEKTILVDRNRLVRGTVVLTEEGVSQRGVSACLGELLDTKMSPSWVNVELAKAEEKAAEVNAQWQPVVGETLSGDEIYSNGLPNLWWSAMTRCTSTR